MMLLEVIPMICFEFFRILEKNCKKEQREKLGKKRALTPQRREPMLRRSPMS